MLTHYRGGRARLYGLAVQHSAFAVVPLLFTALCLHLSFHDAGTRAVDFHHEFWPAARRVLDGQSPYALSWQNIGAGVAFPYPALTALAFVPLGALPLPASEALYTFVNLAAVAVALWVLDVRDWRIYGLAFVWAPVVAAWQSANLTLILVLGIACLWRVRDRPPWAGLIVAALVSLKPFLWPLVICPLVTRRWRQLAWVATWGAVLNLLAWLLVGFDQLSAYRALTAHVTHVMERRGYSLVNLGLHLGWGIVASYALVIALLGGLLVGCLRAGGRGEDRTLLGLALGAALLATPVLWTHYFALLLVPIALARPRLAGLWFVPMLLWLCPSTTPATWQILLAGLTGALAVALALVTPGRPPRGRGQAAIYGPVPAG
jgi:hypothetical protein